MRKSFVFNCEWQEVLMEYPAEVRLEVYDAIIEYVASGRLSELKPLAKMAFSFIRKEIDLNNAKYDETVKKRSEAGKKGMASRYGSRETADGDTCGKVGKDGPDDQHPLTKLTKDNKANKEQHEQQKITKLTNVTDNVYDNDYVSTNVDIKTNTQTNTQTNARAEDEKSFEEKCMATFKFFNDMTEYYKSAIRPVKMLTDERRRKIEAVVGRYNAEQIRDAIRNAMTSDYLNGRTKRRNRPADFDWIFDEANFVRIFEGNV